MLVRNRVLIYESEKKTGFRIEKLKDVLWLKSFKN